MGLCGWLLFTLCALGKEKYQEHQRWEELDKNPNPFTKSDKWYREHNTSLSELYTLDHLRLLKKLNLNSEEAAHQMRLYNPIRFTTTESALKFVKENWDRCDIIIRGF